MTDAQIEAPQNTDWTRIALLWLCGMGAALQFAKASVAFDALAAAYQAGPALAGWLLSAVGAVSVVFGATAGLIVGRVGRRRSLIAALAAASALSLIQAALPPVSLFLATRILEGVSQLAIIVAAPISLPELTAPRHRAIVLAFWGTFFSVAFLLAGVVGPPLLDAFGLGGLFIAHGAAMAALLLLAFLFVHPDEKREKDGRGRRASFQDIVHSHIDVYANPRSAIPSLCFLCYTGLFLALQTLTPALAALEDRPWLVIGMPLISIGSTLLAGVLVQYWLTPFRLTALAFAAVVLSSAALHLAASLGVGVVSAGLARMAFVSLLPGAIYPMIPLLCAGAPLQARAYGAIAQLGNVGTLLGPPIFAASLAAFGPVGLMVPTLALSACGVALASFAARRFAGEARAASPQGA
ncbi:MAG TPA: MFS transporter [Roseiarcus sp.]|nr:MFS transporter [Roseiarcus sp.]